MQLGFHFTCFREGGSEQAKCANHLLSARSALPRGDRGCRGGGGSSDVSLNVPCLLPLILLSLTFFFLSLLLLFPSVLSFFFFFLFFLEGGSHGREIFENSCMKISCTLIAIARGSSCTGINHFPILFFSPSFTRRSTWGAMALLCPT